MGFAAVFRLSDNVWDDFSLLLTPVVVVSLFIIICFPVVGP